MKSSWFTETQIVLILNETDGGMLVKDLCRKHGIVEVGLLQAPRRTGRSRCRDHWRAVAPG